VPGPWASSADSCGGEPDIDNGLWDSLEDEERDEEKEGGGRTIGKAGPLFFEEEGELGNDIKKAVNRIEYSRVENDINKQSPILKFISSSSPPPIIKYEKHYFPIFFPLSPHQESPSPAKRRR
jgi:hypothetical protein